MSDKLIESNPEIVELITKLAKSQIKANESLFSFNNRLKTVEDVLEKEVYLTNSQLRELSRQVKDRVHSICAIYGYQYSKSGKILFQAIYRSINGQYNVMSYRELPRAYFKAIIESVQIWEITESIQLRLNAA